MWELTVTQIVTILSILFASALLQSTIGFAGGVFGIPLLLWCGLDLPEAVGVSQLHSVMHCSLGVYSLRDAIVFRDTLLPIVIRMSFLPVGLLAMRQTQVIDPVYVKQIVGCILLGILACMCGLQVQPRSKLHWSWTVLAFVLSGFLGGFCGMGGVFMALWVMVHDWGPRRSRGFLMLLFLTTLIPQGTIIYCVFPEVAGAYVIGLAAMPVALAGTWAGLRCGDQLPREGLRRLVYLVLALIAIRSIAEPFL